MEENIGDDNKTVICFHTDGEWTGDDVVKLITSVNQMYDVFYSYRVVRDQIKEQEREYMRNLERSEMYFHKYLDHPMYKEFYHIWHRMIKDWYMRGHKAPFMVSTFPFQIQPPQTEYKILAPSEVYDDKSLFQAEKEKLIIDRIHIASPGGFSFTGIGEIIEQLRELIKDLWYRNNQEKTKGDLEIIEKYLKVQREYADSNIPPVTSVTMDRKMLRKMKDSIGHLRSLEDENKLVHVGKHIDDRPS